MVRIRLSKQSLLPFAVLVLAGCPDTEGSMDDFVGRTQAFRPGGDRFPDAAPPAGFFDASGNHILALAAGIDPSKPGAFLASVVVDATDDANPTIQVTLTALTVADRSVVGSPITADPVPLNRDDGTFSINFGRITIDGAADPIVPDAPIEADLVLTGQTNSVSVLCGAISGNIFSPAEIPLDGTFGSNLVAEGEYAGVDLVGISKCPAAE